jgi:hypothetical protein
MVSSARHQMRSIFLILFVPIAVAAIALAASPFRLRDMGNRVEGVEDLQEQEALYQVRGFLAYQEESAFTPDTSLHILFFVPPNEDRPVFIEAQEVNDTNHYHMRPKQVDVSQGSWAEFSGWPVRNFLLPLGISAKQLAVVVRRGTPNADGTELTPAILHRGQYPHTVDHYTLEWKTDRSLRTLTYKLVGPNRFDRPFSYRNGSRNTEIDPFDTHALDIDASGCDDGWCMIRLVGKYPNSTEQLEVGYRFFRKRIVP